MFFKWLKQYMPRGLYGRAALILVLPVLLLQLLVSVVFIQRHFEGVTRLMTSAVNIELRFIVDTVNAAEDVGAARIALRAIDTPLEMQTEIPAVPIEYDDKALLDLTGATVIETLREGVSGVLAVSLQDRHRVAVWIDTKYGAVQVVFLRGRVSATNPHQLLVIMVIMGALMTTISYFFLRNQLRPIKRLSHAASEYGKGRMVTFHPGGALEVRAAGMAFLDMRNRIERQTQSRTMMLSGVSHDLRTPLTRLRLGLSMIDDAEVAPLLRDVEDMQHLLDTFLDFARNDAGDVLVQTDPGALVRDVLKAATRNGQNVTLGEVAADMGAVALRPLAIRRALDNLIGNALRYGTVAQISATVTDRAVLFCVEDDGPGIPAGQRDDAIRPFVRLDPARNQDKGSGVGLGLSIVADIARTHGGTLRLGQSTELGGLKAEMVLAR